MVGSAGHLKRVVLGTDEDLPNIEDAEIDTIYMKASTSNNTQLNNSYVEFMVINGIWEIIGNTMVDLSNYLTKNEADEKYLQSITTGDGLTAEGNQISIDSTAVFILNCGTSTTII